jgi:hypothetical protein
VRKNADGHDFECSNDTTEDKTEVQLRLKLLPMVLTFHGITFELTTTTTRTLLSRQQ